ncbi:MAG: hypothetical protein HY908_09945 [Myxococcales bacterium]|nr:hypothetical protein [Myxococcales bacterium]
MTEATAATDVPRTQSLRALIDQGAKGPAITAFLDALAPAERVAEVLAVTGKRVGLLYEACEGAAPLAVEDFVPASVAPETTVIFEGRNSLPSFTRFQKRFARLPSGQVVGYNHQTMSFFTGPGFFVVRAGAPDTDVPGELYFDYTASPEAVPAGWPSFKPNDRGLSRLVYAHMKDYIRRVAKGVVVGKAFKRGKAENAYFSLSRAD